MRGRLSTPLGYGHQHKYSKAHKLHESKESVVYEALEHIPRLTKQGIQSRRDRN